MRELSAYCDSGAAEGRVIVEHVLDAALVLDFQPVCIHAVLIDVTVVAYFGTLTAPAVVDGD